MDSRGKALNTSLIRIMYRLFSKQSSKYREKEWYEAENHKWETQQAKKHTENSHGS